MGRQGISPLAAILTKLTANYFFHHLFSSTSLLITQHLWTACGQSFHSWPIMLCQGMSNSQFWEIFGRKGVSSQLKGTPTQSLTMHLDLFYSKLLLLPHWHSVTFCLHNISSEILISFFHLFLFFPFASCVSAFSLVCHVSGSRTQEKYFHFHFTYEET